MTPHAPLQSRRTQATSVCHVQGLGDGDAPTSPSKDTRLAGVGSTAWLGSVAAVRSHARSYSPQGNSYEVGHAPALLFSGGAARSHPAGK